MSVESVDVCRCLSMSAKIFVIMTPVDVCRCLSMPVDACRCLSMPVDAQLHAHAHAQLTHSFFFLGPRADLGQPWAALAPGVNLKVVSSQLQSQQV